MQKKYLILNILLAAEVIAAWRGMDFSPGFSAIFIFVFVVLTALASIIRTAALTAGKDVLSAAAWIIGLILVCIGCTAAIAAGYIYAVGDDALTVTIRHAVLLTVCSVFIIPAVYTVCDRIAGRRKETADAAPRSLSGGLYRTTVICFFFIAVFSLAAGWFMLLCGRTCPALYPCGCSMIFLFISEFLRLRGRTAASLCALAVSLILVDAFLLCPMLFAGI